MNSDSVNLSLLCVYDADSKPAVLLAIFMQIKSLNVSRSTVLLSGRFTQQLRHVYVEHILISDSLLPPIKNAESKESKGIHAEFQFIVARGLF